MGRELKATVLVVEDDAEFRSILADVLSEAAGCRIVEAENGACALHILRALTPDLILTDLAMPEVDGLSLLTALQQQPHLAEIPCLVLTGAADRFETTRSTRTLTKPVRLGELLAIVDTIESSRPQVVVHHSGFHGLD
jgi:CheY-like chemotaxis protein